MSTASSMSPAMPVGPMSPASPVSPARSGARRLALRAGAIGLALAALAPAARAQAPEAAAGVAEARLEVQVVVPPLQRVALGAQVHPLPDVTAMDLVAGYIEPPHPIRVTLFSNCPWELRLRRAAGGLAPQRSDPAILWKAGRERFVPLDNDWTTAAAGPRAGGTRCDIQLRIPLSWSTSPPGVVEPRLEVDLVPMEM